MTIHSLDTRYATNGQHMVFAHLTDVEVAEYLEELRELVGEDRFRVIRGKLAARHTRAAFWGQKPSQVERDEMFQQSFKKFHISVANPEVCTALFDAGKNPAEVFDGVIDYEFVGLGSVSNTTKTGKPNTAFYVVVKSTAVEKIYEAIGMEAPMLHVTLGFDGEDIHDQIKDETTLISK